MIRKAVIVVLTLLSVGTIAVQVISRMQSCPVRGRSPVQAICPVRLCVLRSPERWKYGFVYAVSHSWYSSMGYLRLTGGSGLADGLDGEAEAWFHAGCVWPLVKARGRIVRLVRVDEVGPTHWFQRAVVVPRGSFFLAFVAYPTIAFIRGPVRRWRRKRQGRCLNCGYSLMGNVTGSCPECGTKAKIP